MNEGMWQTAEFLTSKTETPLNRSDPNTYESVYLLNPIRGIGGGLFKSFGWAHAQYVWDVRSNIKVAEVFEHFYGTKELLVSFDGINCGLGTLVPESDMFPYYRGEKGKMHFYALLRTSYMHKIHEIRKRSFCTA